MAASREKLKPGKDIGILSFNETALKKVVANGITTISVDYANYGKILARMMGESTGQCLVNPTNVYIRNSI
jgi:DNA-binding LacI/PurR family transcriptional regulator